MRFVLNRHRNEKYWEEVEPDRWRCRVALAVPEPEVGLEYPNTAPAQDDDDPDRKYIVIGRGVEEPLPPTTEYLPKGWL